MFDKHRLALESVIEECRKMFKDGPDCPECSGLSDENAFNIKVLGFVDTGYSGGHLSKLQPRKKKKGWVIEPGIDRRPASRDSDKGRLVTAWQSMGSFYEIPVIFTKSGITDAKHGDKAVGLSTSRGNAIGVLLKSSAGNYTLAHELGHIIGYEGTTDRVHAPPAHKEAEAKEHDTGKTSLMHRDAGGTKPDCHYCLKLGKWTMPRRAIHRP